MFLYTEHFWKNSKETTMVSSGERICYSVIICFLKRIHYCHLSLSVNTDSNVFDSISDKLQGEWLKGNVIVQRALLTTTKCSWHDRELISLSQRGPTPVHREHSTSCVGKTALPAVHKGQVTPGSQDPIFLRTERLIVHSQENGIQGTYSTLSILSTENSDSLLRRQVVTKVKASYHVLVRSADCSENGGHQTKASLRVGLVRGEEKVQFIILH